MEKIATSFKPKEATKKLLSVLTKRGQDVIVSRYGLGARAQKLTLDAIGKKYSITRERVRQIENHSLATIRKSKVYKDAEPIFVNFRLPDSSERMIFYLPHALSSDAVFLADSIQS